MMSRTFHSQLALATLKCKPPHRRPRTRSHLATTDSTSSAEASSAEARVSARRSWRIPSPNPALPAASRRPETAAAAVARGPAAAEELEPVPGVPPGFKKKDADSARLPLKRKAEEGILHPDNTKAKIEDASSDEEEEYPPKWPDFTWERPGGGSKVTYELNLPRVRIFAECTSDSDDELCQPITYRAPPNAQIEAMVEDLRVAIKRCVYFCP